MTAGSPAHLPIVKEYARRLGLEAVVERALDCGMRAGAGKIFLGLVMNVLAGRSPLYRVEEFFGSRDAAGKPKRFDLGLPGNASSPSSTPSFM